MIKLQCKCALGDKIKIFYDRFCDGNILYATILKYFCMACNNYG